MVAVRSHDADRYVAAPPEGIRLFLIYGSDSGAVTERARHIERVALRRGGGETVLRIGSDELSGDAGRVSDEAYSASLFGGEPVISLRVLDGRHNVLGAVEGLIARPPDDAWLIVEAGELQAKNALRKAFEQSSHAAALPSYHLDGAELVSFIHAAASEAAVTLEPAAVDSLAANLTGDRLAGRNELEKLFLYVGERKTATAADVAAVVGDTAETRADEAIDAALLGRHEALELELQRARADGRLGAIGTLALRHLISVQALRLRVDAGEQPSAVVGSARPPIFGPRKAIVEAELRRWPVEALATARQRMDRAVANSRMLSPLADAAISEALHDVALTARRLKRSADTR